MDRPWQPSGALLHSAIDLKALTARSEAVRRSLPRLRLDGKQLDEHRTGSEARLHGIASIIAQTARGTEKVNANSQCVTQATETVGGASAQVLTTAECLSQQAVRLRSEVVRCLDGVGAA